VSYLGSCREDYSRLGRYESSAKVDLAHCGRGGSMPAAV